MLGGPTRHGTGHFYHVALEVLTISPHANEGAVDSLGGEGSRARKLIAQVGVVRNEVLLDCWPQEPLNRWIGSKLR